MSSSSPSPSPPAADDDPAVAAAPAAADPADPDPEASPPPPAADEASDEKTSLQQMIAAMVDKKTEEMARAKAAAGEEAEAPALRSYTSHELHSYRMGRAAQRWPDYLDAAFANARGNWDPDRWHQNRRRGSTPEPEERPVRGAQAIADARVCTNGTSNLYMMMCFMSFSFQQPRRDAKDRLKGELQQDHGGLVLSPQRRSFLGGCQGQQQQDDGEDPSAAGNSKDELNLRPETAGSRRGGPAGSGRLLGRDQPEYRGSGGFYDDPRAGQLPGRRDRSKDRERKHSDRDAPRWTRMAEEDSRSAAAYERPGARRGQQQQQPTAQQARRSGTRFGRREAEEPEWMSAPVSKGEMMELRGFDDSPEKKELPKAKPREAAVAMPKEQKVSSPPPVQNPSNDVGGGGGDGGKPFNFDDFFHMDAIPGLANILADDGADLAGLAREQQATAAAKGPQESRFSKFFQQRSASPERRRPPHPEDGIIPDVVGGGGNEQEQQQRIRIPSPASESCYFAPISPAAKTTGQAGGGGGTDGRDDHGGGSGQGNNPLMDLLQGGADHGAYE